MGEHLTEIMDDESRDMQERQQAALQVQQLAHMAPQMLEQVIEVRNPVAELDTDITVDQSFDMSNVQEEQFQLLAQLAANTDEIDILSLIKLSTLRGKDELIEEIEQRRAQAQQAQGDAGQIEQQQAQLDMQRGMVDLQRAQIGLQKDMQSIEGDQMTAAKTEQEAIQKKLENQLMILNPDTEPQVSL
jgi:hypothetical protein